MRGDWIDPDKGEVSFGDYAARWLKEPPNLRPRTIELYELLLRLHINPYIGAVTLGKFTTPVVRS
jgi:hypothetical protein